MATLLLAETDPKLEETIHEVEAMCHEAEIGVIVHYDGEDLDEILDCVDSKILVFSPKGKLTLGQAVKKYGAEVLLVVGGFTEKRELKPKDYRADNTVSLGPDFLTIPEVIERITKVYESKAKDRGI